MWKITFSNPSTSESVYKGHQGPKRGLMRRDRTSILLNAQNTEKSVSAIRAAEIFIFTSSEEADEDIKLPKLPIIPLIKKKFKCDQFN